VGPNAGLDDVEKRKIFSLPEIEAQTYVTGTDK
jgi:hypothetical protein